MCPQPPPPHTRPQLLEVLEADLLADALQPKRGMKDRFGRARVKRDGSATRARFIAPMHVLHTQRDTRYEWIDYSALDAKVGADGKGRGRNHGSRTGLRGRGVRGRG
jgi:hypothetical protein